MRSNRAVLGCLLLIGCGDDGGARADAAGGAPDGASAIDAPPSADGAPTWGSMCGGGAGAPVVTGQVMAPNGTDPVSRAQVYVPRQVLPIAPGVACDLCSDAGDPAWVSLETGIDGRFAIDLSSVPLAEPVRLAVRKGRFRKVTDLAPSCGMTAAPPGATVLPGDALAGDLPKIAVATGNVDHLDELLSALGITSFDCYEGRVTAATNCPAPQASGQRVRELLTNAAALDAYNLLFLSCAPNIWSSYTDADRATIATNLAGWVGKGGRLFVTDHSYDYVAQTWPDAIVWHGPPRTPPAPWEIGTLAGAGANVGLEPVSGATYPAVVADADLVAWLKLPEIGVASAPDVAVTGWLFPWSVQKAVGAGTRNLVHGTVDWDYAGSGRTSEDLPLTSDFKVNDCGRVVYSSYHTAQSGATAQERILEYLMLDVASCLVVR